MNEALALCVTENTELLIKEISRFDYPAFNHRNSEEKWTAGEISEHLLMFDIRLNSILHGESIPANRDPQENIRAMHVRFEDNRRKLTAPDFLVPRNTVKDPVLLTNKIISERTSLLNLIRTIDLSLLYHKAPIQFYGILSGIEWINFLLLHTIRHINQLEEI